MALREHFPAGEYAVIPQVPDATSYRKSRTADALVMGLWSSRGIYLHGVEIKVDRGDWSREKKNPLKAETIAQFCDYWWIAAGNERVVELAELPENWGLLAANDKGKLRSIKPANRLEPKPITRDFLAGLMRAIEKATVPFEHVETKIAERMAEEREKVSKLRSQDVQVREIQRRFDDLKSGVDAFERESGIKIDRYGAYFNEEIGRAVALLRHGSNQRVRKQIADLITMLEGMTRQNRESLAAMEEFAHTVVPSPTLGLAEKENNGTGKRD
jgi:hypothetical protein